ncbi:MAG: anti sigma factor C-terminal domain-containing protein [Blautia wexlerae]
MADQKKFTTMMEKISGSDRNWSLAADYIEENGLKSYGFVCVTTKADMEKMLMEDHILGIAVEHGNKIRIKIPPRSRKNKSGDGGI